jgi:hypothetical protein
MRKACFRMPRISARWLRQLVSTSPASPGDLSAFQLFVSGVAGARKEFLDSLRDQSFREAL